MIRLNGNEHLFLELAAIKEGLRLATWARDVLIREAVVKLKREPEA